MVNNQSEKNLNVKIQVSSDGIKKKFGWVVG